MIQAYLSGINPEWIKKSRLVKSNSSILYLVSAFLLKKEAISKEKEAISKGKEAVSKGKKKLFLRSQDYKKPMKITESFMHWPKKLL